MNKKDEVLDVRFEQLCLREQLGKNSLPEYVFRAARVRRLTGMPLGYEALRRYFRLRAHLSVGTLRGVKSAVLFLLDLGNKPMGDAQAARLDDLLDGLECYKGVPQKIRGAPTPDQIQGLVRHAHSALGVEDALALVVGHGCAMRSNELEAFDAEDFDEGAEIVWVSRKGRRLTKIRKGFQVERPVTTPEALRVLVALKERRSSGRMFPGLDTKKLSEFVKLHAEQEGWNSDLWWSGIHNLRHGLAAQVFREGVQRTRDAGSWLGGDAEGRYGRQGRIGPKDKRYSKLRQA